ncbi:MAG: hypothetical protein EPO08_03615 [Rhodospirillaceae bacterium]|nr:MAG: hypothetical protein EPO08_03615 [Rhodospirillaceae bacterium]
MQIPFKTTLLSTVAIGFVLQALPAAAQVEEIVVTARKREESILKVPVVETALTQKTLEEFGTHDMKTLAQNVPALAIGSNLGDFGAQVSIRGIGNTTLNATVDQAVSLNIDGVQMSQGLSYSTGMFDVGQVEVLEGPQALFYGKSTTGGVISLHSNDPTDKAEVIMRGGYETEASEKKGEFIVSGPVTDDLKLRLATSYSKLDGYFTNTATGFAPTGGVTPRYRNFAPTDELIMRGTAIWTPSDKFDFKLKANYSRTNTNGDDGAEQLTSCPNGTGSFGGLPFISPNEDCKLNRNINIVDVNPAAFPGVRNNGVPFNHLWQAFGTLQANYHAAPDLTITSVTGYYKLYETDLFNGTDTGAGAPLYVFDNNFARRDVSEELRANSDFSGPLNFTAGGYYQNGDMRQDLNGLLNQFLGSPFVHFQNGYFNVHTDAISFFGQGRYKIVPNVELSAGARWSHETHTLTEVNGVTADVNPGFGVPVGPIATGVPRISSNHVNPEFTITYTPTDDLTLFGSYKEATKSGGFQTSQLLPAGQDLSFSDEGAKGGEVGVKARAFDRQANLNLSGYKYNYTNLQVGENIVTNGGLIVKTINAGTAGIWGAEFSGTFAPEAIEGLTLNGALNYNHARFGTFKNAPCWGGQSISQGCNQNFNPLANAGTGGFQNQDLHGRPLIKAPEVTANFGFDYSMPVAADMKLALASNTNFSGHYYTDLAERGDMVQHAFFKTNLSVTLSGPNDAWEISMIGTNLTDKVTTGYCANSEFFTGNLGGSLGLGNTGQATPGITPDDVACNADRGRELWIRLTVRPLDLLRK